jgi:hypothetical protein
VSTYLVVPFDYGDNPYAQLSVAFSPGSPRFRRSSRLAGRGQPMPDSGEGGTAPHPRPGTPRPSPSNSTSESS